MQFLPDLNLIIPAMLLLQTSVATEDNRNILLWIFLAVTALILLSISTILSLKNRKNRQDGEEEEDGEDTEDIEDDSQD